STINANYWETHSGGTSSNGYRALGSGYVVSTLVTPDGNGDALVRGTFKGSMEWNGMVGLIVRASGPSNSYGYFFKMAGSACQDSICSTYYTLSKTTSSGTTTISSILYPYHDGTVIQ